MRNYFHCRFAILLWAFLHLSFALSAQFSDGDGSASNPYQISNRTELEALASYVGPSNANLHFRLTADIDLAGADWTPIGSSFRGKLHGGGYHIKNILINATSGDWIGLFSDLGDGAYVDNVHIVGGEINVTQDISDVGALAGVIGGDVTILGCSNSAQVNVSNGANTNAGGLIGSINYSGSGFSLTSCVNTGTVTGSGKHVGGLIGYLYAAKGTISDSYSQALIQTQATGASAGGLVGYITQSDVTLGKCYAAGRVHVPSGSSAAGLAGFVDANNVAVTITQSVAAQDILTGPAGKTHRIVGENNSGTLSDNYAYDAMLVNGSPAPNGGSTSNEGQNRTLALLRTESTYSNLPWSIGNVGSETWNIRDGKSYPYLQWQSAPVVVEHLYYDNVSLDIQGAADVLVYRITATGATFLEKITAVASDEYPLSSSSTINPGDNLSFITYEAGKQPSYPVVREVSKRNITISATSQAITYGEDSDLNFGEGSGYSLTAGTLSAGHALAGNLTLKNAATKSGGGYYKAGDYTFNSGDIKVMESATDVTDDYYEITFSNATVTINKLQLTHNITASNKVYDRTTAASYTGGLLPDNIKLGDAVEIDAGFRLVFKNPNVGDNKEVIPQVEDLWTLAGADGDNYEFSPWDTQQSWAKANISVKPLDSDIIAVAAAQTYTGSACTTTVVVAFSGATLTENTDYTIDDYSDNINAGAATVTIRGKGNYDPASTKPIPFTIHPMTIEVEELTADNKTYDGTTAATLTFNEEDFKDKLVAADRNDIKVDYPTAGTFSYIGVGTDISVSYSGGVTLSEGNAANYDVIPQQTGLTANITPKSLQDPSISIQPVVPAHTYTGSSVTPSLIVVDADISSSTLTLGTDYTVRTQYPYIDVGPATITIAGTGNYSNMDTREAAFTIVQKPITITELTAENKTYDGTTAATITFGETAFKSSNLATVDWSAITVTAPLSGTFTQSGVGINIPVNAATVTLSGDKAKNYAVTQQDELTAEIMQKYLDASDLTIALVADEPYTGEAIEPSLTVTEGANTLTLNPAKDYTVAYADNIDAGTASATVTITSTGNYSGGASASTIFTILQKPITITELTAENKTYDGTTAATLTFDGLTFKSKLVPADWSAITVTAPSSGTFTQSDVGNDIEVTAATVTLGGDKAANYDVTQQPGLQADIQPKAIDASDLTVVSAAPQTFTGLPCTTTVVVAFGANTLIEGTDYIIDDYSDNINAGIATVTIRGAGNYDPNTTKDIPFTIHPMTIEVEELSAQDKTYDSTSAATLTLDVPTFKAKLAAADRNDIKVDYPTAGTFSYTGVGTDISVSYSGGVTLSEGNAANYEIIQQQTELSANIIPKSLQDLSISIQSVPNQIYTGSSVTPSLIVVDADISSSTLTLGTDYTVRTQHPYIDVGAATITIAGAGNYSNTETISAAFTIVQKSITITELTAENKTFDGTTAATITFDKTTFKNQLAAVDWSAITVTTLLSGTFTQSDVGTNIPVNAATVTLSGDKAKNYAVTQQTGLKADITQKHLDASDLAIAFVPDQPYTGMDIEPSLTVTEGANTLRPTLDYTVTYADNINAGTASATVTITGTGNYSGNASTFTTFTILKKAITVAELTAQNKTYDGTTAATLTFDRPAFESKFIAVDLPFLTITEPSSGTFAQSNAGTNIPVTAADVALSGAKASNYDVTQQTGLKADIMQKAITASDLTIAPVSAYTYIGTDIEPPVVVAESANTLTPTQDYTVSYANNRNAGMATITVTITGTGNYSGNASTFTTFLIMPKDINEAGIAPVPNQTYTGAAITPALTVTDGATTLMVNTDYTVAYDDNITIGTAAATITGINNYTNTRQISFNIIRKSINDADITIVPIPAQTYTGATLTPSVTVLDGAATLTESTDYTTTYANNTNAGTATVMVTGTGNYNGSSIVTFEILKADQTITFPDIPPLWLIHGSYTLQATATSGFPVTYMSSNPAIVDIGSDGVTLQIKQLGTTTITAYQQGNSNYNPAPPVQKQVIVEESGMTGVLRVTVIGAAWDAVNDRYLVNCSDNSVIVIVEPEDYTARVYYNNILGSVFTVEIPAGAHRITYKVASGANEREYAIEMAKPFRFDDVVQMRWNNTLTVINNPANNGGFHFTSFTWYGDGRQITTKQSFSAGNTGQSIDPEIVYHVALTAEEYAGALNTCPSAVTLRQHALDMVAYPNPVQSNGVIFVEINMDEAQLDHAEIEIINIVGSSMGKVRVAGRITPINTSALPTGIYLLNLRGKNDLNKIVKVLVQ